MENWEQELKIEIIGILKQYSPTTFINSTELISEKIVSHLIYEYGFSKINPDTVSELDILKKDIELKKCQTCKNLNKENNYCKNLERFVNVEFCCIEHCL